MEYRGGSRGRGRSRSIERGKGSSRDAVRGNSRRRGRGQSRGRGRQGRNSLSSTGPADSTFQWTSFDSCTPPRHTVPFQEDSGVAPIATDVTNPLDACNNKVKTFFLNSGSYITSEITSFPVSMVTRMHSKVLAFY